MGYSSVKSCACACARACALHSASIHRRCRACKRKPDNSHVSLIPILPMSRCDPVTRELQKSPLPNACVNYPIDNTIDKKKKRAENGSSLPPWWLEPFQTRARAPPCIPRNRRRPSSRLGAGAATCACLLVRSGFGRFRADRSDEREVLEHAPVAQLWATGRVWRGAV
jgi:hypothetical protein